MSRAALLFACLALCAGAVFAAEKPRVFITDSKSWEIAGGGGGTAGGFGAATRGGARPQTAEIIKTFGERCPNVIVNNKQDMADFIVLLDHEGGKGWLLRDNKVAVFNKVGDSIMSHSTRSLGNSVQDACAAITKDWAAHPETISPATSPAAAAAASAASARVSVASGPDGADIEVDGNFVGSTPSLLDLKPGPHTIVISKSGYKPWQRKLMVEGSTVNVAAQLEKQ